MLHRPPSHTSRIGIIHRPCSRHVVHYPSTSSTYLSGSRHRPLPLSITTTYRTDYPTNRSVVVVTDARFGHRVSRAVHVPYRDGPPSALRDRADDIPSRLRGARRRRRPSRPPSLPFHLHSIAAFLHRSLAPAHVLYYICCLCPPVLDAHFLARLLLPVSPSSTSFARRSGAAPLSASCCLPTYRILRPHSFLSLSIPCVAVSTHAPFPISVSSIRLSSIPD